MDQYFKQMNKFCVFPTGRDRIEAMRSMLLSVNFSVRW